MKKMKDASMKNYNYSLANGIRPSPEFAKKGLAQYAINVGLRCGHDCTYCSSRAMLRCHPALKKLGKGMSATGFSVVDPDIAERVAKDAKRIKRPGLVQICTTVAAWAPEAQQLGLGRDAAQMNCRADAQMNCPFGSHRVAGRAACV